MIKNRKSGFTIIEVVVSMALIAIVLSTTFLFCGSTFSMQNELKLNNFFLNESEKITICYFEGASDYTDNIEFATGLAGANFESDFVLHYNSSFEQTDDESAYFYDFSVSFDLENSKIVFEAKKHIDNQSVFQKEVLLWKKRKDLS